VGGQNRTSIFFMMRDGHMGTGKTVSVFLSARNSDTACLGASQLKVWECDVTKLGAAMSTAVTREIAAAVASFGAAEVEVYDQAWNNVPAADLAIAIMSSWGDW